MLKFKDTQVNKDWEVCNPPEHFNKLKTILQDGADFMQTTFNKDIVITSIHRDDPPYELHQNWRAIDTRTVYPDPDSDALNWTDDEIKQLVDYINTKYPYDINRPDKPTVLLETKGQMGSNASHLHWQVMA